MNTSEPGIERTTDTEPPASRHQFLGTWELVAWLANLTDSAVEEPYGTEPNGYITYTADGYMQAIALTRESDETVNTVAYAATWDIQGREVVHHVTASVIRDWIGTDQVRTYTFDANQLTLTMQVPDDRYIALVWRKVENHAS